MIDDYVLIKFARQRGYGVEWPEQVKRMKDRIKECLLGFPGIGLNCLSLIPFSQLNLKEDIWILDPFLETERTHDWAPLMFSYAFSSEESGIWAVRVEGIGAQEDFERDPTRKLITPGRIFTLEALGLSTYPSTGLVLRVDCRPKKTGGAGYHYFYRAKRDNRP